MNEVLFRNAIKFTQASLLAALLLYGGAAQAGEWIDLGNNSGVPPSQFRLERFDPETFAPNRCSSRPHLAVTRGGSPVMTFFSSAGFGSYGGIFGVRFDGNDWGFLPGSTHGAVRAEQGFTLPHRNNEPTDYRLAALPAIVSTPANAPDIMAAMPGVPPLEPYANAHAGFRQGSSGWEGRGDSLGDGIMPESTFTMRVFETAALLDPFGTPYMAISRGSDASRGIYVASFRDGEWTGLPGGLTTPLVAPGSGVTNLHPAMSFSGGNPVVAWTQRNEGVETVRLLRYSFDAEAWLEISGSNSGDGLGQGRHPQVANFQNRTTFYAAFESQPDNILAVKQWIGSAWVDLGDPLEPWGLEGIVPFDDANPSDPEPRLPAFALALDRRGDPAVAFRAIHPDVPNQKHIFVSYYDRGPGEWRALGNTAEPTGITDLPYQHRNNPQNGRGYGHYNPSLVFGIDNHPIVAWEFDDGLTECPAILLKRFDEPAAELPPSPEQAVARLLLVVPPDPEGDERLDANEDGVLDAADVITLR